MHVVKAYEHIRACSAEEVVLHILPGIYLSFKGLSRVWFVNPSLPENQSKIPRSEELGKLRDDNADIFKPDNTDQYM